MYRHPSLTSRALRSVIVDTLPFDIRRQRAQIFFQSCRTYGTRPPSQRKPAAPTRSKAFLSSDRSGTGRSKRTSALRKPTKKPVEHAKASRAATKYKASTKNPSVTGRSKSTNAPRKSSAENATVSPEEKRLLRKLKRVREGTFRQASAVKRAPVTVLRLPAIGQHLSSPIKQLEDLGETSKSEGAAAASGKWARKRERMRREEEAKVRAATTVLRFPAIGQHLSRLTMEGGLDETQESEVEVVKQNEPTAQTQEAKVETKNEAVQDVEESIKEDRKDEYSTILTALRRIEMLDGPSVFKQLEALNKQDKDTPDKATRSRKDERRQRGAAAKASEVSAKEVAKPKQSTRQEAWGIQKSALEKKFGEKGWQPRKRVSPDTLEGIRALHASDPAAYSTATLASHFQITPEAVRRILKSKWKPNAEEIEDRMRRWEKRGVTKWAEMSAQGVKPPKKWREMGVRNPDLERKAKNKEKRTQTKWEEITDMADRLPMEGSFAERIV